jgi:hypothetical protein
LIISSAFPPDFLFLCIAANLPSIFAHLEPAQQLKTAQVGIQLSPMNTLHDRLARHREIDLIVTGRKSGKTISNPVWFVAEGDTLYLLPVRGSETQWYQNVLKNSQIRVHAPGAEAELRAKAITEPGTVKSVVEKFRQKYGAADVSKYYSKFDVAVHAQ